MYNIDFLGEVDSTNSYLKTKAAQQQLPDTYAVAAQHQSAGRGQRGNRWESEPYKNLLASFYVAAPGPTSALSRLNHAIALAVLQVLSTAGVKNAKIKWPNDIYVGDRKIAGVLTDTVLRHTQVTSAVVGLGFNVNQNTFDISQVTSLATITGVEWDLVELLKQVYDLFYANLALPPSELLYAVNIVLYKKGERVTFGQDERTANYTVVEINSNGDLLVQDKGETIIIQHHKMKWLK